MATSTRNEIMRRINSTDGTNDPFENENRQRAYHGQTPREGVSRYDTKTPDNDPDGPSPAETPRYKNGGYVAAHASGKRDYPKGKR